MRSIGLPIPAGRAIRRLPLNSTRVGFTTALQPWAFTYTPWTSPRTRADATPKSFLPSPSTNRRPLPCVLHKAWPLHRSSGALKRRSSPLKASVGVENFGQCICKGRDSGVPSGTEESMLRLFYARTSALKSFPWNFKPSLDNIKMLACKTAFKMQSGEKYALFWNLKNRFENDRIKNS